jgi:hypothetical protein
MIIKTLGAIAIVLLFFVVAGILIAVLPPPASWRPATSAQPPPSAIVDNGPIGSITFYRGTYVGACQTLETLRHYGDVANIANRAMAMQTDLECRWLNVHSDGTFIAFIDGEFDVYKVSQDGQVLCVAGRWFPAKNCWWIKPAKSQIKLISR